MGMGKQLPAGNQPPAGLILNGGMLCLVSSHKSSHMGINKKTQKQHNFKCMKLFKNILKCILCEEI